MVPAPTKLSSTTSKATSKRSAAKRLPVASSSNAAVVDEAALRLCRLASSLPSELITSILEFAAATAIDNPAKLRLLCLSKYYHDRLSPLLYHTIALCSSSTIHAFASLVKSNPKTARHVRRLWVGPDSSSSDLITALSPPAYNEASNITEMREHVHTSVRYILRSCRKLQDVALAGELLSLHAAHTYGSACQPVRLTSVNPHSFVGGFSAPIFRKVRVLRIVDTNLAFEEADEIRTLAELEWLIWTAPKDYGDISRDSNVLRRLLQRPRKHFTEVTEEGEGQRTNGQTPLSPATAATATPISREPPAQVDRMDQLWMNLSALELSEGLAPARPSKNDRFRRLTIQSAQNRCAEFRHLLADSFPLHPASTSSSSSTISDPTGGLAAGLDATFEDLEREWDPALNVPTIHPTVLSATVLDEWDALRDLINNAAGQYSNLSMWDVDTSGGAGGGGEAEGDAENALRRQRSVWECFGDVGVSDATKGLHAIAR
ncbi:hypothetical protein PHSY_003479 [Pseudozyma hubeiensis SY62]|uniref:Uncharacterized protein n=1 Tax=Pseudozyma hubeiensis (strain SY62) TaxID=1305764 RepID=R9P3H8_PSEHS|nr:hypothetical protein PHSY_003479 [Pseudozyma hubeiensis SY62]GAC95901.1 hypothetical protein PHSY_003479 [Pseudozyma hubeiensis SY62]